jgi:hypothetical protein
VGRKATLVVFWFLGYVLGVFAWLVGPGLINSVANLGLGSDVAGGVITGLAGSMVMLFGVVIWGRFSSN